MGFCSRNRFSEKTIVASSRMKAAPKVSLDQSTNYSGVKSPGTGQQIHQKDIKSFSSQKMIKFTKKDQKTEFATRNRRAQQTNKASPKKQATSKNGNCNKSRKDLICKEACLNKAHQKKSVTIYPESEPKSINVNDQLSLFDRLSEDYDCMWLSSDGLSSSFLSSDESQDTWDLDYLDQFTSMSSSFSSRNSTLDEANEFSDTDISKSSTGRETLLVLDRASDYGEKDVDELVQLGAFGNEGEDSSVQSPSSYQKALSDDSSISNISNALLSSYVDSPTEFDRTGIWLSSLDLENEDCDLIQVSQNIFGSNFPSPSLNAKHHQKIQSSRSCLFDSVEEDYKNLSLDFVSNEPLFWPLDWNLYSCLDLEKFLRMPLEDESYFGDIGTCKRKVTRMRLHDHRRPQVNQKDAQRVRRALFEPTPKSATKESAKRVMVNGAKTTILSSLGRAAKSQDGDLSSISKRRGRTQFKDRLYGR